MDIKLVCFDDEVFKAMVETIVRRIKEDLPLQDPEFVDFEGAKKILGCERTKLRELMDEGKVKFSQKGKGCRLRFVTASLREYQRSLIK